MSSDNTVCFPIIGKVYSSELPGEEIGNIAIDKLVQVGEAEWCCYWTANLSNLRRGKIYGSDALQAIHLALKHLNFLATDFDDRRRAIKRESEGKD